MIYWYYVLLFFSFFFLSTDFSSVCVSHVWHVCWCITLFQLNIYCHGSSTEDATGRNEGSISVVLRSPNYHQMLLWCRRLYHLFQQNWRWTLCLGIYWPSGRAGSCLRVSDRLLNWNPRKRQLYGIRRNKTQISFRRSCATGPCVLPGEN